MKNSKRMKSIFWFALGTLNAVGYATAKCSNCFDSNCESDFYPFCPYCGCKMDEKKIKEKCGNK